LRFYRAVVKKGLLTRDEAARAILDEAVSRAIQAEATGMRQRAISTANARRS
jgi:hypothetical protein